MRCANLKGIMRVISLALATVVNMAVHSSSATAQSLTAQEIRFLCAGASTSIFQNNSAVASGNGNGLIFKEQEGSLSVFVGDDLLGTVDGADYQAYTNCVLELVKTNQQSSANPPTQGADFSAKLCSTRSEFDGCFSSNEAFKSFLNDSVGSVVTVDVSTYVHASSGDEACHNDFGNNIDLESDAWQIYLPTSNPGDCFVGFDVFGDGRKLDPDSVQTLNFWYGIRGSFHVGRVGTAVDPGFQLTAR